ncbi:MAG: hypothetical protein H7833_00745 [Magnetococcus sp. DMHC-1]|nr:hypothetical protein [Magnetococcales bacterium]
MIIVSATTMIKAINRLCNIGNRQQAASQHESKRKSSVLFQIFAVISFFYWFICGFTATSIAVSKGYNGLLWFILSVFGPVSLLLIWLLPTAKWMADAQAAEIPPTEIQSQPEFTPRKCKNCGAIIEPEEIQTSTKPAAAPKKAKRPETFGTVMFLFGMGIVLGLIFAALMIGTDTLVFE